VTQVRISGAHLFHVLVEKLRTYSGSHSLVLVMPKSQGAEGQPQPIEKSKRGQDCFMVANQSPIRAMSLPHTNYTQRVLLIPLPPPPCHALHRGFHGAKKFQSDSSSTQNRDIPRVGPLHPGCGAGQSSAANDRGMVFQQTSQQTFPAGRPSTLIESSGGSTPPPILYCTP
jgi:hypothetical protein